MADLLGSDLACVFDVDPRLGEVKGRRMLAEAIARRWLTPEGGLFYDPTYGAGLIGALHGSVDDLDRLARRLEDQALQDERVQRIDVRVVLDGDALEVAGRIQDAAGPFRLTLDVSAVSTRLLVEEG